MTHRTLMMALLLPLASGGCGGESESGVSARDQATLVNDGRTTERLFDVTLDGEAVRVLTAEGGMPRVQVEVVVAAQNARVPGDAGTLMLDGGVVTRDVFFERTIRVRLVRLRDEPRTAVEIDYFPDAEVEKTLRIEAFDHCVGENACRERFRLDLLRLDDADDALDVAFRVSATVLEPPMELSGEPLDVDFIDPTASTGGPDAGVVIEAGL